MATKVVMEALSPTMEEGRLVKWLKNEGDQVAKGDVLAEVETDKAQVEIPSPLSGRVEKVHVQPGQSVKVGQTLVTFADGPASSSAATATRPQAAPVTGVSRSERSASGSVAATPVTRRLARELGVNLREVHGTGPGGRVTDADVRGAASGAPRAVREAPGPGPLAEPTVARPVASSVEVPPLPRFEQWGPVAREPLSHLRRTIAERMTLSATVIPHVAHLDRADISELDELIRRNLEAARARGVTLTLTSFLLKAAALTLREHPRFNASLDPTAGELILKRYCHLGVAVATDRGLIVPVIRDVDRKPVMELAGELAALAARVREGKATLDELRGGSFTITNIGALGGTGALPIINYPEVAILGVARATQEAVVREGRIVPRLMLPLTLMFDHRVADGADGARFAAGLVRRLEHPDQLLLDL